MFDKIFRRNKKPTEPEPLLTLSVPYSEHFKGYKRIKLTSYRDPIAEAGIQATKDADRIDRIRFELYQFPNVSPLFRVLADQNRIGTIWMDSGPEYFEAIQSGRVSKASVAWTGTGEALLFIKIE